MRTLIKLFFASLMCVLAFNALGTGNSTSALESRTEVWQFKAEVDGIQVYQKKVPPFEVDRVKTTTLVNGSVSEVFDVLITAKHYPNWLADCARAEIIEQLNPAENIAHVIMDAPWPVDDREIVFHRTISGNESEGFSLDFYALDSFAITQPCCVRVVSANGFFRVEPAEDPNQSLVTYEFVSDPGGHLPKWLVNYVITDAPIQTLKNLKGMFIDS